MDGSGLNHWPWLTWGLSAVIALVSIAAFFDLRQAVDLFGFVPAHAWRYGGLTSLTSFFLHGGVGHLAGNLYFLLLCGTKVEDYLGRWRFALLLLLATVTGDCLHALADPRSTMPCIGASGGISGVLVFYALEFPRSTLSGSCWRFYWRFAWIRFPAWVAIVIWIIFQFIGAARQLSGLTEVSSLAHLGGSAAGSRTLAPLAQVAGRLIVEYIGR